MNMDELRRIKALSHPLRIEIMSIVYRAENSVPIKEVAEKLSEAPAKLHYHFKQLEGAGYIEVVDTREVNGITERYYGPTEANLDLNLKMIDHPDAALAALPVVERQTIMAIRRLSQVNPDYCHVGYGFTREIYIAPAQAAASQQAVKDFFDHKSAQFPEECDHENGDAYDLIVILSPKELKSKFPKVKP